LDCRYARTPEQVEQHRTTKILIANAAVANLNQYIVLKMLMQMTSAIKLTSSPKIKQFRPLITPS